MNYSTFSQNKNLTPFDLQHYQSYPVLTHRGPLSEEYLKRLEGVIAASLAQYSRLFSFRCDLRFPAENNGSFFEDNSVIDKFFASFKAKIKHNRNKAKKLNPFSHYSVVRYVWCREIGMEGKPHFHLAILLNYDAFCTLGTYELGRDNLFNRLVEAWASALGCDPYDALGLTHIPENPFYVLRRNDHQSVCDFFYRVSYLCKADTKRYGNGVHCFGASRT